MRGRTGRAEISGLVVVMGFAGGMGEAAADDTTGSGSACVVSGEAVVSKDTVIYSAESGGTPLAVYSGAKGPLRASRFPADPSVGRVLVNTGAGFRVQGFTDPRALVMFGARDLEVVVGHVWISASTPVHVVGAVPGKIHIELPAGSGLAQPIRTWTSCDVLTFDKGTRPLYDVPERAQGYVAKQGSLDLYGEPGGSVISTLRISGDGSGLVFWGSSMQRGFVRVTTRSNVFVDAWLKLQDVKALPRGELRDQVVPSEWVQNPAQLSVKDFVREMSAPKNITLYYGRDEASQTVGTLERDAEIYVMETVVGWASVLPKRLHVLPHEDRAFWVKASELGLGTPATNADAGR